MFNSKYAARSNSTLSNFTGDAIHLRRNYAQAHNNIIIDKYSPELYDTAHRDGIQLIPHNRLQPHYHYAGGIGKGYSIQDNKIYSANKLQGIFSGDGLLREIQIIKNIINTESDHYITLSGLLSGYIKDNFTNDLDFAPIRLLPLRIGGNIDGKFNVWIINFQGCNFNYQSLKDIIKNRSPYSFVTDNRFGGVFRNKNDKYLHSFKYNLFTRYISTHEFTPENLREIALNFGKED